MICRRVISYVTHNLQEAWRQERRTPSDRYNPVTQGGGRQMVGIVSRTILSFNLDTFAHLNLPPYLRLHPLGDHLVFRQAFQHEDEWVGRRFDTR